MSEPAATNRGTAKGQGESDSDVEHAYARLARAASGLAHDMRGPLNAIQLELDLLEMETGRKARRDEVRRLVSSMRRHVDSLADMAGDFLSLARIGRHDPTPVDINALLTELAADMELQWRDPPVGVELALETGLPRVLADQGKLRRALMNICTNARDAAGAAGRVRVATRAGEGRVLVTIEDDGAGMTPEEVAMLSQPFYTTKQGGVGLGVQVATEIVRSHGGGVLFESQPGAGTRVTVDLPAAACQGL
jgi:signal transduction histidine kinase